MRNLCGTAIRSLIPKVLVPAASASLAGVSGVDDGSGGQNIGVKNAGWYILVVTTVVDGKNLVYTLEFLTPDVYVTGDPSAVGIRLMKPVNLQYLPGKVNLFHLLLLPVAHYVCVLSCRLPTGGAVSLLS